MALCGNKKVFIKRVAEITEVDNKNPHHKALLKYNHIRVQHENGEEISYLFTDKQIKRAEDRAKNNIEDLPEEGWTSYGLLNIVPTNLGDIQKVQNQDPHFLADKEYNHIVVDINGNIKHLLFTDHEIKMADNRARKNPEDIPKISWIKDLFD
ncbi:MAG: hypothetical protein WC942_11060 [Clostridia bacterium]|jgi:hypothetical protein